jgi:hypothetical protein
MNNNQYTLYNSLRECNNANNSGTSKCVLTQFPEMQNLMRYEQITKPLLNQGYVHVENSFCKVDPQGGQVNCLQIPPSQVAYQAYSMQNQDTSPL